MMMANSSSAVSGDEAGTAVVKPFMTRIGS